MITFNAVSVKLFNDETIFCFLSDRTYNADGLNSIQKNPNVRGEGERKWHEYLFRQFLQYSWLQ